MDYPECDRLTFCGILVAFLELAFAYCLLCVSAFVFIASKFLVYLPCPCSGFFGYQNNELCIQKFIFDWPFEIILRIQKMAITTRTRVWHHQEQEETKKSVGKDQNLELMMNKVRLLEEAVEEERLARASLMVELEEERAASRSAADEAMAMILRLQADKASLEMEGKQYERMIEEKFAYDEEEMNVLKEILFKREREKHFLEKELETYKHIDDDGDDLEIEDREPIVHDVHVIEDDNNAKMKDDGDGANKESESDDQFQMKQMEDIGKDHDDSSASSPSSASLHLS
uniref:GTD-binding domain-containing protein n=1 Tax=Noccaea caerulescens TaxID=107243 RepID=A0A1J3CXY6_NOCCA